MTINELKAIIKLGHGDRIVVLNDNEEIVDDEGINAFLQITWD